MALGRYCARCRVASAATSHLTCVRPQHQFFSTSSSLSQLTSLLSRLVFRPMSEGNKSLSDRIAPASKPTFKPPVLKFALPAKPTFTPPSSQIPLHSRRRSLTPPLRRERNDVYIPEEEIRFPLTGRADVYIPRSPTPPRRYRSSRVYSPSPPHRRRDSRSSYSRSISPIKRRRSITPPRILSVDSLIDPPRKALFTHSHRAEEEYQRKEERDRVAERETEKKTQRALREEARAPSQETNQKKEKNAEKSAAQSNRPSRHEGQAAVQAESHKRQAADQLPSEPTTKRSFGGVPTGPRAERLTSSHTPTGFSAPAGPKSFRGVPTGPRSSTVPHTANLLQSASYSTSVNLQRSPKRASSQGSSSPKKSRSPRGFRFPEIPDESSPSDAIDTDMPTGRGRGRGRHVPQGKRKEQQRQTKTQLSELEFTETEILARYLQKGDKFKGSTWRENPKGILGTYMAASSSSPPEAAWSVEEGLTQSKNEKFYRVTVVANPAGIVGVGDSVDRKEAYRLASLSAILQLHNAGLVSLNSDTSNFQVPMKRESPVPTAVEKAAPTPSSEASATLTDGSKIYYDRARQFMEYYCNRYSFSKPDIDYAQSQTKEKGKKSQPMWDAVMSVGGRRIGMGTASTKKNATLQCYLDVAQYLESCDPKLWKDFMEKVEHTSTTPSMAPHLVFQMSDELNEDIQSLCSELKGSRLYENHPKDGVDSRSNTATSQMDRRFSPITEDARKKKSDLMRKRLNDYDNDPRMKDMRSDRRSLPVYSTASDILAKIEENDVTVLMATTGSGKTTQIPQILLDDYINKQKGAECNIICTQPRRLAATSVAQRIANERGQELGEEVGYQVRFDVKPPKSNGSITFCTTGIFLKRIQSALGVGAHSQSVAVMDQVSHIIVDEVHERDIENDLALVVLKELLADRKARGVPLKVILMSATIDPSLFINYFKDDRGKPAPLVEVPGRTFPVERHYLNDILPEVQKGLTARQGAWVFDDKDTNNYIASEMSSDPALFGPDTGMNLKIPYALVALTIAHAIRTSDDGHVLVFLPGWEEIKSTADILLDRNRPLYGLNFNDSSQFSVHYLHSTIPPAEQQEVFRPPPAGVRRIILATNIAETSVTIPNVVYVVDIGRVKEKRYDPARQMSSLVTGWVGLSSLNQRAGRAGRHRPGQYFGLLSQQRMASLEPHSLVEMKRSDLSEVVMRVKALNLGKVEDVLAATIEPPEPTHVSLAMQSLRMLGAINENNNLTSLGSLLLQIPVSAAIGKLCLLGSFYRCLDSALTLAAVLSCRDPFVAPLVLRDQARDIKDSWSPLAFRSDPLAVVAAYNAWFELDKRGDYKASRAFCEANFLQLRALLEIRQIKTSLLQALYETGVIAVSVGAPHMSSRRREIPPALNENGNSLPLLAALIATASAPNFAIRISEKACRTAKDKSIMISTASVNSRRREIGGPVEPSTSFNPAERRLYAFFEKSEVVPLGGKQSATLSSLRNVTRLDPMTYMLFGAYNLNVTNQGLDCDGWLPVWGNLPALDDIQRLKTLLDACMLRVFEGVGKTLVRNRDERWRSARSQVHVSSGYGSSRIEAGENGDEGENETDDDDGEEQEGGKEEKKRRMVQPLSREELQELELLTTDVVRVLDLYAAEREGDQSVLASRASTRPSTPAPDMSQIPTGPKGFQTSETQPTGSQQSKRQVPRPNSTRDSNIPKRFLLQS
ncbi:hypothetical protein BCR39DRAFT_532387 [Naematelia encephala]|uniref:RNA helicase n=1 Tax=Naematelia encephala TaxID=71784 RepID=A0A1Y2B3C2_9TREE|nr:hypothetical protein BCR39DRAFT_532387 [Naematelia encephala]